MENCTPPILWAQRPEYIFLTIEVPDVEKKPQITLEEQKLIFHGKGGPEGKTYEISMDFYGTLSAKDSKFAVKDRYVEFVLKKKEFGPYWPRLLKVTTKQHWLKIDFHRWKDEEDSEQEEDSRDLDQMLKQMGGMNNMPDMNDLNLGGDDADDEDEDSDDEAMPDLEK